MKSLVVLALVVAAATLVLILWFRGGAEEQRSLRDRLTTPEGEAEVKKRAKSLEETTISKNRPRTEAHVLVSIQYPIDDPRRARFGGSVLSMRGNSVAFARKSLSSPLMDRVLVSTERLEQILAALRTLPETPSSPESFLVDCVAADEKTRLLRNMAAAEVEALVNTLGSNRSRFIPEKLILSVADASLPQGTKSTPWPNDRALPPPDELKDGVAIGGLESLRKSLLDGAAVDRYFAYGDAQRILRITRCEIVLP